MNIFRSYLLVLIGVAAATASAQSEPILRYTFKDDAGPWAGIGSTGKVSLTHDQAIVGSSGGALKFDYDISKGNPNLLYLPTPVGSLAKAKSIKFRVRSDANTLLVVMLQEENGGRYQAMVAAPKDTWQPVELSTSDFGLGLDKGDPKDPDVKLDMDAVSAIVIIDLSQMFAKVTDPGIKAMLDVRPGPHSFLVDDFVIGRDDVATSMGSAGDDELIDTLVHPQLSWFAIGGGTLSKGSGAPLSGTSLKLDYHQAPAKIYALTHQMSPWILTSTKSLAFDVASVQPANLIVQLEDYSGGKYNTAVSVPGGSLPTHLSLKYADFKPAQDSADPHGTLDVGKVKSLVIVEATGATITVEQPNTLWFANFRAQTK